MKLHVLQHSIPFHVLPQRSVEPSQVNHSFLIPYYFSFRISYGPSPLTTATSSPQTRNFNLPNTTETMATTTAQHNNAVSKSLLYISSLATLPAERSQQAMFSATAPSQLGSKDVERYNNLYTRLVEALNAPAVSKMPNERSLFRPEILFPTPFDHDSQNSKRQY